MIHILFVTGPGLGSLNLEYEYKQVLFALQKGRYRDQFDIRYLPAVTLEELREYLYIYEPNILHFSGHAGHEGVILETSDHKEHIVSPANLAEIFSITNSDKTIRCVFLNASGTVKLAESISKYVDCVVGFSNLTDNAAIVFAKSFYLLLGHGRSIQEAFDHSYNALKSSGLDYLDDPGKGTEPKLKYSPGIDPSRVFLTKKAAKLADT
jgi:hypothetical protein